MNPLRSRLLAEFIGTAFLLAIVVGSGIMAERLAQGNNAVALLANAIATGAGLYVLIMSFGHVSGAHFNPAVTLAMRLRNEITTRDAAAYIVTQIVAAIAGVLIAHYMFAMPLIQTSTHVREGGPQVVSEFIATFGLLYFILANTRNGLHVTAMSVALYITAAYWFTSSTSFANPAVTIARSMTDTFAGIKPSGVPWFIVAQLTGATAAVAVAKLTHGTTADAAA